MPLQETIPFFSPVLGDAMLCYASISSFVFMMFKFVFFSFVLIVYLSVVSFVFCRVLPMHFSMLVVTFQPKSLSLSYKVLDEKRKKHRSAF